ncbi:MAG: imidazole glycerol phosphate synthase, glutamine amidotransferase subunit, partial [Acidobacteria bacterium 13_1_40CM_3_65_5]
YGAGNLTSVKKALAAIGADVIVPSQPDELAPAHGVIVPGVGHFGATRALEGAWTEAILQRIGEGRPLLGICLGMQWLFEGSDDAHSASADRRSFSGGWSADRHSLGGGGQPDHVKIPHVGWNSLAIEREAPIVDGIPSGSQMYFTHSYVAPVTSDTVAVAEHGEQFAAVVQHGQIAGVQFHPEKSGDAGLRILRNFVQLAG